MQNNTMMDICRNIYLHLGILASIWLILLKLLWNDSSLSVCWRYHPNIMTCEKPLNNIHFNNFCILGWHNWNAFLLRLGVVRCGVLVPSIAYRWQRLDTCLTLPMLWLLAVALCRWLVLAGWESHWPLYCSPRFTNFLKYVIVLLRDIGSDSSGGLPARQISRCVLIFWECLNGLEMSTFEIGKEYNSELVSEDGVAVIFTLPHKNVLKN